MNPPSSTPTTAHSSLSRKAAPSPPAVINAESSQAVVHDRGPSAASVVTVETFPSQSAQEADRHQASSSAAKKVMDWFRRKSMAKDTLVQLKQGGVKSDSTSSFVRVGESPVRSTRDGRIGQSATNLGAMSSTSSVGHANEAELGETRKDSLPDSATLPKEPQAVSAPAIVDSRGAPASPLQTESAPARTPLGPAANKANIVPPGSVSASDLLSSSRGDTLSIPRSKTSTQPQGSSSAIMPSRIPPRASSSQRPEETKMRVHTGLVDQSALSSKPPKEVMHEVLRVLQEMGIEIKKENEYRLRCARARRRKSDATPGPGLGSFIGSGSGMSAFAMMANASSSKVSLKLFCLWETRADHRPMLVVCRCRALPAAASCPAAGSRACFYDEACPTLPIPPVCNRASRTSSDHHPPPRLALGRPRFLAAPDLSYTSQCMVNTRWYC